MEKEAEKGRELSPQYPGLTLRSLVFSGLGSMLITASSMYVALRMSALPWPTVFVAVLSLAVLRLLGGTNIHEINIAKTGMSAGAMIAGGIAFTLPGLWISGYFEPYDPLQTSLREWLLPKLWPILLSVLAATILGSLLCYLLRNYYLDKLQLAYPIGTAAGQTLLAAEAGGSQSKLMFWGLGLTSLFTLLRDGLGDRLGKLAIPARISGTVAGYPLGLELSPMAAAIGYLIGFGPTVCWFVGALLSHWLLSGLLVQLGCFANPDRVGPLTMSLAIGLMVGAGIGILLQFLWSLVKLKKDSKNSSQEKVSVADRQVAGKFRLFQLGIVLIALVLISLAGLPPLVSLMVLVGVLFASSMSATITGQTGINPMEIFAIIVLLTIRIFWQAPVFQAFLITGIVAVACGYAGDLMNDYKTGRLIGTSPKSQLISEIIGGVLGAVVAVFGLFAIIISYGGVGGDTGLTAAQAHTVTAMIDGIAEVPAFSIALVLGLVLYLAKIPSMIVGIGMLLPFSMSTTVFLGGLAQLLVTKLSKKRANGEELGLKGQLLAAGLLGGEGIVGTVLAIIAMIKG